jgi:membrane protein YqaA with SNARE-associated domain
MRAFSVWILTLFASKFGVVMLAALDSTLFFSLPFGIDAAVILLAARQRETWWIVPFLATAGSVAGAALTFWMGEKIGEKGLDRWLPARRLEQVRARVNKRGAIPLAIVDLMPPPFPFTPFVLAAGALAVERRLFFTTLVVCRLVRFGIEAALGFRYGRRIIAWMDSDFFRIVIGVLIVVAIALTAFSLVRLWRSSRAVKKRVVANG